METGLNKEEERRHHFYLSRKTRIFPNLHMHIIQDTPC